MMYHQESFPNFLDTIQSPNTALGDYIGKDFCHYEFQVGSKLVWVYFKHDFCCSEYREKYYKGFVTKHLTYFEKVLLECHKAYAVAEKQSRLLIPDFWNVQNEFDAIDGELSENRLAINGIYIAPENKVAVYEIFTNYNFNPPTKITFDKEDYWEETPIKVLPPDVPEQHQVLVVNNSDGVYVVGDYVSSVLGVGSCYDMRTTSRFKNRMIFFLYYLKKWGRW